MALAIIQSGGALQLLATNGTVTTLSLPTGVTLRTDVPPRWTVYNNRAVLVNTPTQPLTIDASGVVRLLCPRPPRLAPVLTGPVAGGLTGTYRACMTHMIRDAAGNVLAESEFSPISEAVTVAAKKLLASGLELSPDVITDRRIYRTVTNGSVFFEWVNLDGNVVTSVQDDMSDASLSIVGAPVLGTPPRLTTIAQFRGRLFGTGDIDLDNVRYTEAGVMYAWPAENLIAPPGGGADEFGVVALIPRRDALGMGRRNTLVQLVGSGVEDAATGVPDFDTVVLSRELGVESQETAQTFRDTAYFLWKDGVYTWSAQGLHCISDGQADGTGNVRSWFATDDYFNRTKYPQAFAVIDPDRPCYRIFLASAGSSTIDRWVEYDITDRTWWGPHKTDAFTLASAFMRTNASNRTLPVIGSTARVFGDQATRTDTLTGSSVGIAFDTAGKRHAFDDPDREKFFGQLSIFAKPTTGTLTVTTRTGELDQTTTATQNHDLTKARERLGRIGVGKHTQIEFSNAVAGQDVELYGYEIDPVHSLGRR